MQELFDVKRHPQCGSRDPLDQALDMQAVMAAIAGYFGGKIDSVMMRIVDVLYGLPFIIFIILLSNEKSNTLESNLNVSTLFY